MDPSGEEQVLLELLEDPRFLLVILIFSTEKDLQPTKSLLRSIIDHSHSQRSWTISSSKVQGFFLFATEDGGGVICYFDAGLSKRREKERAGKRQQVWRSTLTDQSLLSLESSQLFEVVESFLLV